MKKGIITFLVLTLLLIGSAVSFADETKTIPPNGTEVIFYAKDINGNPTHSGVWDILSKEGKTLWRINLISQEEDRVILLDGDYQVKQIGAKPGYEIDTRVIDLHFPMQDPSGGRVTTYKIYTKEVKEVVEKKRDKDRPRDNEPERYIPPEVERLPRPATPPIIDPTKEITIPDQFVPLSTPSVDLTEEEIPQGPPIQITTPKHTGGKQIPFDDLAKGSLSIGMAGVISLGLKRKL